MSNDPGGAWVSSGIAGDRPENPTNNAAIMTILATIRKMESGGNYTAINKGDGVTTNWATGAYQFLNSTWKKLAVNVPGASAYPAAYQAPPGVQDQVAAAYVRSILASHNNHLAAVPVTWYYPSAWMNPALLNKVPAPEQGNKTTVKAYAENWLKAYDKNAGGAQTVPDTNGPGLDSIFDIPGDILTGKISPGDVLTGIGGAVREAVSLASSPLDVLKAVVEALSNPALWMRILKVVGGLVSIIMGLWIITHDSGMVPKIPKAAAAAAVL